MINIYDLIYIYNMVEFLLKEVQEDCLAHGYGRKKWWADRLGIPPLTLSHWLARRQHPSGSHTLRIRETLDGFVKDDRAERWKNYLWNTYYTGWRVPQALLPDIILVVLSQHGLDSRTLGLLSRVVEHVPLIFPTVSSSLIENRIGWLLEVSGKRAPFAPVRSLSTQLFLEAGSRSQGLQHYLKRFQTKWGKKWRIYDCPLEEIKKSLPWPQNWNE